MLSVIMVTVVILSMVMLSIILLNVILPSVVVPTERVVAVFWNYCDRKLSSFPYLETFRGIEERA